jgi:hypothetical protein
MKISGGFKADCQCLALEFVHTHPNTKAGTSAIEFAMKSVKLLFHPTQIGPTFSSGHHNAFA